MSGYQPYVPQPPAPEPLPAFTPAPYTPVAPYAEPGYAPGAYDSAAYPVASDAQVAPYRPAELPVYPDMPYPGEGFMVRPEHPQATLVLVLGVLSLVVMSLLGPVAWIMGSKALQECDRGLYTASTQLRAGRICGIIATCLLIVGLVIVVIAFIGILSYGI